jgi:hypothetical protein
MKLRPIRSCAEHFLVLGARVPRPPGYSLLCGPLNRPSRSSSQRYTIVAVRSPANHPLGHRAGSRLKRQLSITRNRPRSRGHCDRTRQDRRLVLCRSVVVSPARTNPVARSPCRDRQTPGAISVQCASAQARTAYGHVVIRVALWSTRTAMLRPSSACHSSIEVRATRVAATAPESHPRRSRCGAR